MNVEVLKRVLKEAQRDERHNTVAETRYWCSQYKAIAEKAIAALAEQPAPVQEPVAWMFDCGNGGRMYAEDLDASVGWLPLYTTPPAAPVQEPVAWGVFEGGNLHDMFFTKEEADNMAHLKGLHAEVKPLTTPPAQRQWTGLTDEERSEIESEVLMRGEGYPEVFAAIEAKLREKNT